jgi:CDP-glycerol glycerophosphotransferase
MPYGDSPKYIIEELKKRDSSMIFVWNSKKRKAQDENKLIYVKRYSLKYFYHLATSKVWISSVRMPYFIFKRKGQIYFQTWHGGLGFKKIEQECENALSSRYIRTAKHDSKMIDYFISGNSDISKLFKEKFWYKNGEILEIGLPRDDLFFMPQENNIIELKEKYNIKNKKVVMYAPTFRKNDPFSAYDIDLENLRRILSERFQGDWQVLVRLHPRLAGISSKFIRYDENIINVSAEGDVQNLLLITDILITDYSSICFDFMNTKRPVFIYASDIEDYRKDRDFHLELEETPFAIATNNQELADIISKFDYELYQKSMNDFIGKYKIFNDGKSSEKIANLILEQVS